MGAEKEMLNLTGAFNRGVFRGINRGINKGIDKGINRGIQAMPPRSAWIESWGWTLLGFGLFLGLACYTFNPFDYLGETALSNKVNPRGVANLAGPVGAYLSASILGRFGIVGIIWPLALMLWGSLTTLGFVVMPKGRRFLAFVSLSVSMSGFAQIQFPRWNIIEPAFGYGGLVGERIAVPMLAKLGYGGAIITLSVMTIVSLVLTGNITISKTAMICEYIVYIFRKYSRRVWIQMVMRSKNAAARSMRGLGVTQVSSAISAKLGMEKKPAVIGSTPIEVKALGANSSKRSGNAEVSKSGAEPVSAAEKASNSAKAAAAIVDAVGKGAIEDAYGLELHYGGSSHERPSLKLFARSEKAVPKTANFKKIADMLTTQLAEFKVEGKITDVVEGPVVTTFEYEPAPGTKVAKIASLGEDLARLLSAQSLRVLAPIPGKSTVGFEVPNAVRRTIGFGDLIDNDKFRSSKVTLPIAMGVDIFGKPVIEDLAEMPHLLVAGSTGSGKSVFMNTLIASLISRHNARDLRLIMIDPKMVEMAAYNPLPHMACPVVTDAAVDAKMKLDGLVEEMEDRYNRMRVVGAKNIKSYNEIIKSRRKSEFLSFEGRWAPMSYVVLIIDELADMMMVLGKEAEAPITRLAQKARAAGIHLVIATQRPSADVVTGLIKANFPTRVAFRVLSGIDSRTILDQSGAETLLGKGDMLYLSAGGLRRMHGAYLSDKEVNSMVAASKPGKR